MWSITLASLDLLDMLFLAWLLAAFVIVAALNLYLRWYGYPRRSAPTPTTTPATDQYLSAIGTWLQGQDHVTAQWIATVNKELAAGVKVDGLRGGSVTVTKLRPPQHEGGTLVLLCDVRVIDTVLSTNGQDVSVNITGTARLTLDQSGKVTLQWEESPEIDIKGVELRTSHLLKTAITNATTVYPGRTRMVGDLPRPPEVSRRPSPGVSRGKRLLVKVVKANGLGDRGLGCCGPYCVVKLDYPSQQRCTAVVQNTVNPFWDEQFTLDTTEQTSNIEFEVFDRDPTRVTPEFLGRASVSLSELGRGSRQIVPLTGKPGTTTTSGSVTIELSFVEGCEDVPKRTVDASQYITPEGVVVSQVVTTRERPDDGRTINNSVITVEARELYPPSPSDSEDESNHPTALGAHSLAITPSFTVTSPSDDHVTDLMGAQKEEQKGRGFAAAIKRKFQRKHKDRAASEERTMTSLQAPSESSESTTKKKRSRSFSSSIRRMFKSNKKDPLTPVPGLTPAGTPALTPGERSRENSMGSRGRSPDSMEFNYSSSLPVTSPIYSQYQTT